MPENFVLDSSALIAFLQAEDGAVRVLDLLEKAARNEACLFASFVSLAEIQYITEADFGADSARRTVADLKRLAVIWIHSDDSLCAAAAEVKAAHKVSFADSFVVATALRVQAILIHKDPEIAAIPAPLRQEMLPAKRATSAAN